MATIGNLFINVIAKTRGLAAGLASAKGMLGKFGKFAASPAGLAVAAFAALTAGIYATVKALKGAVSAAMEFNDAMAEVRMIMLDASEVGDENFEKLRQKALQLGATTKFTGVEAAQGLALLTRAGFNTGEAIAAINPVLDMAASQSMELGEAAEIVAGTLRGFGLTAQDAARVADVLGMTASRSKTTVSEMGEALKYIAPIARSTGITLEETAAMIGTLADNLIEGSMAGTSMRQMILTMVATIHGKGMPALRAYLDENNDLIEISKKFTKRAVNTVDILTKETKAMDELTGEINKSAGAMKEMAKLRLNQLGGDVTLLQSAWTNLNIIVGDQFTESLRAVVQAVTSFIGGMQAGFTAMFGNAEGAALSVNSIKVGLEVVGVAILFLLGRFKFFYNKVALIVNTVKMLFMGLATAIVGAIGGALVLITKGMNKLGMVSDETTKMMSDGYEDLVGFLAEGTKEQAINAGKNIGEMVIAGTGIGLAKGSMALHEAMWGEGKKLGDKIGSGVVGGLENSLPQAIDYWEALGEAGQKAFTDLREYVTGFQKNWEQQNWSESQIKFAEAMKSAITDAQKAELQGLLETGLEWEKALDRQARYKELIKAGEQQWEQYLTPMEKLQRVYKEIDDISETFTLSEIDRKKMIDGAMSDVIAKGEAMKKSLQTPFEKYQDDLLNINQLFEVGAINAETQSRALQKLRDEAMEGGDVELLLSLGVSEKSVNSLSESMKGGITEGLSTALGTIKIAGQVSKTEQLAEASNTIAKKTESLTKSIEDTSVKIEDEVKDIAQEVADANDTVQSVTVDGLEQMLGTIHTAIVQSSTAGTQQIEAKLDTANSLHGRNLVELQNINRNLIDMKSGEAMT